MSLRAAAVAALAAVSVAVPVAGAGAATSPSQAPVVSPARYLTDVQHATDALKSFGVSLTKLGTFAEFRAKLPSLRRQIQTFDRNIRRLRTYRLSFRNIDAQRARLAASGPALAKDASSFLDAIRDLNEGRARSLSVVVLRDLRRFEKAAQVSS
jgi:hypothetical protein